MGRQAFGMLLATLAVLSPLSIHLLLTRTRHACRAPRERLTDMIARFRTLGRGGLRRDPRLS